MKRVWKKNDKEGVSPVIATILMVAITVVLAAVLYVMVSGYMQNPNNLSSGAVSYAGDISSPSTGKATFTIALSAPNNPQTTEVSVKVLDHNQNIIAWRNGTSAVNGAFYLNWTHLVSDPEHIMGGDRLSVTSVNPTSIAGYEISVSFSGYSGSLSCKVPS